MDTYINLKVSARLYGPPGPWRLVVHSGNRERSIELVEEDGQALASLAESVDEGIFLCEALRYTKVVRSNGEGMAHLRLAIVAPTLLRSRVVHCFLREHNIPVTIEQAFPNVSLADGVTDVFQVAERLIGQPVYVRQTRADLLTTCGPNPYYTTVLLPWDDCVKKGIYR